MPNNFLTPVNRSNKFYSEQDYEYELSLLMEYLEEDLNQTVVVYQVDRERTNTSAMYKEAEDNSIRFKPPKEIPCHYTVEDSQLKTFDNKTNTGVYSIRGNLTFYTLNAVLEKYKCDVRRGDYIGVLADTDRMIYYVVVDDGKVNVDNSKYVGTMHPTWLKVVCAPCDDKEFNGK